MNHKKIWFHDCKHNRSTCPLVYHCAVRTIGQNSSNAVAVSSDEQEKIAETVPDATLLTLEELKVAGAIRSSYRKHKQRSVRSLARKRCELVARNRWATPSCCSAPPHLFRKYQLIVLVVKTWDSNIDSTSMTLGSDQAGGAWSGGAEPWQQAATREDIESSSRPSPDGRNL